jgi:hypothetical protein
MRSCEQDKLSLSSRWIRIYKSEFKIPPKWVASYSARQLIVGKVRIFKLTARYLADVGEKVLPVSASNSRFLSIKIFISYQKDCINANF